MKFDNIRLLVSHFDDCLHFYETVMGFSLTWGEPGGNYASFDVGEGSVLALFKKELIAETVGTTGLPKRALSQDSFMCIFEVSNLEETVREIKKRGGTFESSIQEKPLWGISTAHVRDPDGNLIELITKLPQDKWDESLIEQHKRYS
ncbi:VOC family protein [Geomicrobium sp. JCM 19038]|uniref:VOC family protein n=1 Tax=Geomicrobium sp. JCM 19038 TaxID=1460635 RepID=UPI00045F3BC0|nr:VOC family protein [Geomicrobium sp. JCM 19038]GAK08090.1 lactoylglutathione lyase [Geomicrobium sp. JCM 19038]